MAGLIKREDIDELRSRISIVDVVSDHVTLKSAGVGSLKGLCPFHDERTPSFHVRPAVGRYHCFGCGEDGDVFAFVMAIDHTTFQETVERLASGVGFTLHYEDGRPQQEAGNRQRLLAANQAAADFFQEQLRSRDAEAGHRFLGERAFDMAAAERFGVGYAPKSFDALRNHLKGRGFSEQEQLLAGLLSEGQRGAYDRFRGRLAWPIRDVTGAVVGFGARKLFDDDQGPKYLNTPETAIFHKSQILYGLDLAKRDIGKQRQAVVVEGYTDVMACHLAGVTTAIATCGTAFGTDHISVLRRVLGDVSTTDTRQLGQVIFTFDPDEAGQKAASRAFAEEQRFAAQTFVAVGPDGLDPCDLRIQRGDDAVRRLVETRRPLFEFMLRRVITAFDLETVEGRVGAARAAGPIIASIRDRALADGYVRQLAGWLGSEINEVRRLVVSAARERSQQQRPASAQQTSGQHGQQAQQQPRVTLAHIPTDPATRLEQAALVALLQHPQLVGAELAGRGAAAYVANASLEIVRDGVLASLEQLADDHFAERVAEAVPAELMPLVHELAMSPIPESTEKGMRHYVKGIVVSLVQRDILRQKAEVLGAMQRLGAGDPEASRAMSRRLVELEAERRRLTAE